MATGVGKSNYLENAVLNHFLKGGAAIAQPTALYVGLFTDASGLADDQPATEATSANCAGYTRQPVTFGAAASGVASNTGAVTFTAAGAWATINYVGIFDALTGGNMLYWGPITPVTLANTNQQQFAAGQITVKED